MERETEKEKQRSKKEGRLRVVSNFSSSVKWMWLEQSRLPRGEIERRKDIQREKEWSEAGGVRLLSLCERAMNDSFSLFSKWEWIIYKC